MGIQSLRIFNQPFYCYGRFKRTPCNLIFNYENVLSNLIDSFGVRNSEYSCYLKYSRVNDHLEHDVYFLISETIHV